MSLFKKKSQNKDKKIYMPFKQHRNVYPKRKRRISGILKSNPLKDSKFPIKKVLLYILLPIFFVLIIYFAVTYINTLRNRSDELAYIDTPILGITDVPQYPYSSFIFDNNIDDSTVSKFLSEGNSAYRLTSDKNIDDVFKYYTEILPGKGWELILTVPLGSEEQKYGQYWIKENKGLRIYSKFNDVWYESITKEDAQTGLASLVKKEIERNLLLIDNDAQDLLPDFPWIIKVPKEYIISYSTGSYENFSSVSFKKLGTTEIINIVPMGERGGKALDTFLFDYVKYLNKESKKWAVKNTYLASTNVGAGLKGTIVSDLESRDISVLHNTYNNIVYVLDCNISKSPFFTYIIENIQVQDRTKY